MKLIEINSELNHPDYIFPVFPYRYSLKQEVVFCMIYNIEVLKTMLRREPILEVSYCLLILKEIHLLRFLFI